MAAGAGANGGVVELVGDGPLQADGEDGGFLGAGPGGGLAGRLHGEIKDFAFGASGFASLLHQASVDFLEKARHGGEDGGLDFEKSLSDVFDHFDVGYRATVEDINVVEHAAVDVGKREK